jgi:hypothetical protein
MDRILPNHRGAGPRHSAFSAARTVIDDVLQQVGIGVKTIASIYELKVTLQDSKPPVWRRFRVPSDVSLIRLHGYLQRIMGWTNAHMHQFIAGGWQFGTSDPDFPRPTQTGKNVPLNQVLLKPNDRFVYEYDFGDGWQHEVVLERIVGAEPDTLYPYVMEGERACPPEDCGGIAGYHRLVEALASATHPDHDALLESVGGSYDPVAFDPNAMNQGLHPGWKSPKSEPAI